MHIWFDTSNNKPFSFQNLWTVMTSVDEVMNKVQEMQNTDDFVKLINIEVGPQGEELADKLAAFGGLYQVLYHGDEPTEHMKALTYDNLWDKKVISMRTAHIIMILKGRHNLSETVPDDIPYIGDYYHEIALYLSDECGVPFRHYITDKHTLSREITDAVFDYLACTQNSRELLTEFFDTKRRIGDSIDYVQCWAAALVLMPVRKNGKYIRGFSDYNTKPYERRAPFEW